MHAWKEKLCLEFQGVLVLVCRSKHYTERSYVAKQMLPFCFVWPQDILPSVCMHYAGFFSAIILLNKKKTAITENKR